MLDRSPLDPPGGAPITLAATCALVLLAAGAADGQDCRLRYAYAPAPGSQEVEQVDVARGQTTNVGRDGLLYVENVRSRPLSVRITVPTGGTKWVELEQDGRDPPSLNYVGMVELQRVRCLHLYDSPVGMFTALHGGSGQSERVAAEATVDEFDLDATGLLQHLQAHISAGTAASLLRDRFGHGPDQLAGLFRDHGYAIEQVRDALWSASTASERGQVAPRPPFTEEAAILAWLRGPFGDVPAAEAVIGYSGGSVPTVSQTASDAVVRLLKGAGYTAEEAAATIRAHGNQDPASVTQTMIGSGSYFEGNGVVDRYTPDEVAPALSSEFGASPVQVAQWLAAALPDTWLHVVADALAGFGQPAAQVTAWLVGAGFPPTEVALAVGRSSLSASLPEIAAGFATAGVEAAEALQTFEDLRAARSSIWGAGLGSPAAITTALREGGFSAGPVAVALRQVHSVGSSVAEGHRIASWLVAAEYAPAETVQGLRAAYPGSGGPEVAGWLRGSGQGFVNSSSPLGLFVRPAYAARGLRAGFSAPSEQVAGWLVEPWHPVEQAVGIHAALSRSGANVAAWMKASRPPKEIGASLKEAVTDDRATIARYLLRGGFSAAEAAEAIRHMGMYDVNYNLVSSPEAVAVALRDGGYSYGDIAKGMAAEFPGVGRGELTGWLCGDTSRRVAVNTRRARARGRTTFECPGR